MFIQSKINGQSQQGQILESQSVSYNSQLASPQIQNNSRNKIVNESLSISNISQIDKSNTKSQQKVINQSQSISNSNINKMSRNSQQSGQKSISVASHQRSVSAGKKQQQQSTNQNQQIKTQLVNDSKKVKENQNIIKQSKLVPQIEPLNYQQSQQNNFQSQPPNIFQLKSQTQNSNIINSSSPPQQQAEQNQNDDIMLQTLTTLQQNNQLLFQMSQKPLNANLEDDLLQNRISTAEFNKGSQKSIQQRDIQKELDIVKQQQMQSQKHMAKFGKAQTMSNFGSTNSNTYGKGGMYLTSQTQKDKERGIFGIQQQVGNLEKLSCELTQKQEDKEKLQLRRQIEKMQMNFLAEKNKIERANTDKLSLLNEALHKEKQKNRELEVKIDLVEQSRDESAKRVNNLESQWVRSQDERERRLRNEADAQACMRGLKTVINEKDTHIHALEAQLASITQNMNKSEKTYILEAQSRKDLQEQNRMQIRDLSEKIVRLKKRKGGLVLELDRTTRENASLKQSISQCEQKAFQFQEQKKGYKLNLEESKLEVQRLTGMVQRPPEIVEKVVEKLVKVEVEKPVYIQTMTEAQTNELNALRAGMAELDKANFLLKESLNAAELQINDKTGKVQSLKEQVHIISGQAENDLRLQNTHLIEERRAVQLEFEQLGNRLALLERRNQELEQLLSETVDRNDAKNQQISAYMDQLINRNQQLENKVYAYEVNIDTNNLQLNLLNSSKHNFY